MNSRLGVPSIAQEAMDRRDHVPSQEEARRSFQLIEEWKSQLAVMKAQVSAAEQGLAATQDALNKELEGKISALRTQYDATKKLVDDRSQLNTRDVRLRLEETQKRLSMEQAFVSGIRRIPDEILVEILKWHLKEQLPTRRLACVCKSWRLLIQRTPSFWRYLEAQFFHPDIVEKYTSALQRRIALSRSALLDITLALRGAEIQTASADMFKIVAATGIERWRSLSLVGSSWMSDSVSASFGGMFKGTFSALVRLELSSTGYSGWRADPFVPIYEIIIQSRPCIKEVKFGGEVPQLFQGSPLFKNVSRITALSIVFTQIPPMEKLQDAYISGWDYSPYISSFPPLPTHTAFEASVRNQQLQSLQRQNVQSLRLPVLAHTDSDTVLAFPELTSLSIGDSGVSSIAKIVAPKLSSLSLTISHSTSATKRKESSYITSLLRNTPDVVMIQPESLRIDIGIATNAVLALLQHWPQLQQFELVFGKEFSWNGAFPNSLNRKVNPLCPNLITLRMHSTSSDFSSNLEQWRKTAKSIFVNRKHLPLSEIEWKCHHGNWESLTASD